MSGSPPSKRPRLEERDGGTADDGAKKDVVIATLLAETRALKETVAQLKRQVEHDRDASLTYYASHAASENNWAHQGIPQKGLPAKFVSNLIQDVHLGDFNPRLNTSSYVNVVSEEEERRVATMGAEIK